jgi:hypothetical protein
VWMRLDKKKKEKLGSWIIRQDVPHIPKRENFMVGMVRYTTFDSKDIKITKKQDGSLSALRELYKISKPQLYCQWWWPALNSAVIKDFWPRDHGELLALEKEKK